MPSPTVVIENCAPQTPNEQVHSQVVEMLAKLPGIDEKLNHAKRIFIKLNLGVQDCGLYLDRPIAYTDPAVYEGLAIFLQGRTDAEILAGDGTDGLTPTESALQHGHMAIVEKYGHRFVDLNQPPSIRFIVPCPVMFKWYEMSAKLQEADLWFSVAKMKSHSLCGISLTLKNLFGLPSNQVYASPRFALHSPIRLPKILSDLAQICSPAIGLIDGIIGENYTEWGGDPVSSSVLMVGDNLVAVDAVGAQFMGVDPQVGFGTPPFIQSENHLKIACERGLGPLDLSAIHLIGSLPDWRKPFSVAGGCEPEFIARASQQSDDTRKNAHYYFENRADFVQKYRDEIIFLSNGNVFFHEKVAEGFSDRAFQSLDAAKLDLYEVYSKLVQAEEAELITPYE